ISRNTVVDLYEIETSSQVLYSSTGLTFIGDRNGALGKRLPWRHHKRPVEESRDCDTGHVRPAAPRRERLIGQASVHLPHTSDSVPHQEPEILLWKPQVHVHVPQTWDQKLAFGVDGLSAASLLNFLSDGSNAVAFDFDREV